jgi:hypothetical protein
VPGASLAAEGPDAHCPIARNPVGGRRTFRLTVDFCFP